MHFFKVLFSQVAQVHKVHIAILNMHKLEDSTMYEGVHVQSVRINLRQK